ncbi:MAG: hypothetical protein JXA10_18190 [Anaerolineae bacterium]|nr:hypothetical protein [Anaerolineae bacterium]
MQRWRWLWIWVGVLVAGCGQVWSSGNSPSPTREPTLPLLGYTLLPPSFTPSIWPRYTATPLLMTDTWTAPPIINLSGTTCYETPVDSLVCLGQFHNPLSVPLEHVMVTVQLLAPDGLPLAAGDALVARWMIPPAATGPYRVIFDRIPDGYAGVYTFVQSAQPISDAAPYAALTIQPVSGMFVLDQYQVTLSLINRTARPVEQIAITMVLLDRDDRVTGFRRVLLDADRRIAPGESVTLTMKVIPQGENTVGFDAFAEGFFVGE